SLRPSEETELIGALIKGGVTSGTNTTPAFSPAESTASCSRSAVYSSARSLKRRRPTCYCMIMTATITSAAHGSRRRRLGAILMVRIEFTKKGKTDALKGRERELLQILD